MDGLFARFIANATLVAIGGWLGYVTGHAMDWPMTGAITGAAAGAGVFALFDALKAIRLSRWLSGSHEAQAPRDKGFWGELGYRVERAIRLRDKSLAIEQTRLAQFLSAIEASPNGVLLLNAAEQITWCNSVAADHFGLDPAKDKQQRVTNLVRAPAFVSYLQAGQFGEPVNIPDPSGRGTLSILVRPYGDNLKLVLSQDITERDRADAMRRDFVANVSHEIRTPLTVLAGFIETMTDLPLSEAERRRVLATMSQQAQRIQTLVSDLLTLAQLEGSPRPPSDKWASVSKLLAQVQADGVALSKGRHQISVSEVDAFQLAGTESELGSAIGNLMTNAVRYTPEGGRIALSWVVRADGRGEVSVTDTGIGVAREHIPRLTERFYRVDGSRSRETGGTGLGLSIVKHVIQRHGGEMDVKSEPGKGSSFTLLFPAARVRPAPLAEVVPIGSQRRVSG